MRYDTPEGIKEAMHSLEGFDALLQARKGSQDLRCWIVWGRVVLTSNGGAHPITEGAPADVGYYIPKRDPFTSVPAVMSEEEAQHWTSMYTMSYHTLPRATDLCPWCNRGWGVRNITEFSFHPQLKHMHPECRALRSQQLTWGQLDQIRIEAGFEDAVNFPVPSRYGSNRAHNPPWMVMETPQGRVTFGWRKRVISIDWSETHTAITEPFASEDVTKEDHYIHAWGPEKAVTYLKAIREALARRGETEASEGRET